MSLLYVTEFPSKKCTWVIDAVHKASVLDIKFPVDHDEQEKLAEGFKDISEADFDCCAGAIDGILIWTECPTENECKAAKCGSAKFFCGRKKKFGLNMMATVDHLCRFIDIQISHLGASSDFLAFATSNFKSRLDQPGFLSPGLVLFGDNAYTNSAYMVTPFKGNQVRTDEDNFNFFHSQLRIQVECAFGQLVH